MTWTPNIGTADRIGGRPAAPEEIAGASRIKWGALLGVLGLALAIGGVLVVLLEVGLGVTNVTASGYVSLLHTILLGVILVVLGVILALLSFLLYTAGFASLRKADRRFRTPMVLCVIGLLGLALIVGFVGFYASGINSAIACPSSNSTCQNNATSIAHGEVALGYVGGLLGFIGLIGAILGLYRFGSRYSSTLAKVGAILYIIPVLSILAPILVFIGAHSVLKKLRHPAPEVPGIPPPFPAPPPPT
jgi:hypothetical protein